MYDLFYDLYNGTEIEFEIKNIATIPYAKDREIIETLKSRGYLTPRRNPTKTISHSQDIGAFVLKLLNNYKLIKKSLLCDFMKLLDKYKIDWENKDKLIKDKFKDDYTSERKNLEEEIKRCYLSMLMKLLTKLEKQIPKLAIFRHCALDYINDAYRDYETGIKTNKEALDYLEPIKDFTEINIKNYNRIQSVLQKQETIDYLLQELTKAVWKFANDFLKGKQLIENSFIHNDNTRNNKFSGIQAVLPVAKIDYALDGYKCPTPYKYNYEIKTVEDLFNVTIYQLTLNRKVIIQCKNCGKYLIPDRTDRQYCPETNCKNLYMSRKSRENSSIAYNYYRTLYNRYKNTKTYKEDFEKLKSIYYNQYLTKQIDNETFMKILTDFEENVKTTHNLKRGRPKKNKNV